MSTSNKVGGVRKCPNCGATVDALAMQCSECGHMFSGTEAADVLKQFEEKVNAANMFSRAGVIKRFPVPNTQEALFSLIAYLEPLTDKNATPNPMLQTAYQAKFRECMTRAKIAFPNHPTVLAYDKIVKQRNRKNIIIAGVAVLVLLLLAGGGSFFLSSGDENESESKSAAEVENYDEGATGVTQEVSDVSSSSELPAGWDKMYLMSGKYMYCSAEFPCSDGTFTIDLFRDGISISLTSINADKDSFAYLKIGKASDTAIVDASGDVTFKFDENYAETEIAHILAAISSGRDKAYIEIDDTVYTVSLTGAAAKNVMAAYEWAHGNPDVLEI